MEVNSFDLIGFDLFGVDLNSIDINTYNSVSVKDDYIPLVQNPYINGHITTSDNTFTFSINNTDVTVNVDSNGNFKYKPISTITSLSFVGVPQLESLELFKINGVTTFDVDYPTNVTFIKCDNTTISSKNDVYHIRGTATDDFNFTLKYIDGSDNVTTVTENAVIDENGKWDIAYSSKVIKELASTFLDNSLVKSIEFTENLNELTYLYKTFTNCSSLTSLKGFNKATFNKVTNAANAFQACKITELDMHNAEFNLLTNLGYTFYNANAIKRLDLSSIKLNSLSSAAMSFAYLSSLVDLYVPNNGVWTFELNIKQSPLSFDSMLRVAGWLKDLKGGTSQTVTFRKATYDALTAEQKATLQGIIVTQKNWILATA